MTVKILLPAGFVTGKLAEAELHFTEGPLEGLKLIGFSVWEGRNGARNVTFPARQYSVNGERRSFALLRPSGSVTDKQPLIDTILQAYREYEYEREQAQAAAAQGGAQ